MNISSTQFSIALLAALLLGQAGFLFTAQVALSPDAERYVETVPGARQVRQLLTTVLKPLAEQYVADLPAGMVAPQGGPSTAALPRNETRVITLHEEARIFLLEGFLTHEECDHIIHLAETRMKRSYVVDTEHVGGEVMDDIRTSSGTFLARGEDPIIREIEKRIAKYTLLPAGNGEALQVLRYEKTQKYGAHYDYFFDTANVQNGGNRYATFLMYLNDVEEGGETTFPNIPAPGGENGPEFSECARYHLAAKPRKGSAVLFHSMTLDGKLEKRSMHAACPVTKGEKWSAPKWIHQRHFSAADDYAPQAEAEEEWVGDGSTECEDQHELCADWAASGECEKNKKFMVGSAGLPGDCLKSCGKCDMLRMGLGDEDIHMVNEPVAAPSGEEEA